MINNMKQMLTINSKRNYYRRKFIRRNCKFKNQRDKLNNLRIVSLNKYYLLPKRKVLKEIILLVIFKHNSIKL